MAEKRNTWQKDAVSHALTEAKGFVSAQQLFLVLKQHGSTISLATVYRALTELVATGKADTLQSKEGEALYRDCSAIEAQEAESWASKVAKENGFSEVSHTIEIFGVCKTCSS